MTSSTEDGLPEQLGRYRLLDRLGAGGMGTVYRAVDTHLDRIVAIKVPRLDGSPEQRETRRRRFQREARAAARILHPHVCPIFDVGEHEGKVFVVMAYLPGPSLAEVLRQRGRLGVSEAVGLVCQVLEGLAAVHAHGIVHRDIKPGNILLDGQGRALLTDFGLARPEGTSEELTSEGVVLGTPAYMAPEQAAVQPDRVGPWTDLYAVGVVLYQLLTARLPFEGPALAVLGAIVRDEPPPPRRFRPDLDPDLERLLLRALNKDPARRFTDAVAMAAELHRWQGPTPAPAPTVPLRPSPRPTAPGVRPWHGWGGWLVGGVIAATGGAGSALIVWAMPLSAGFNGPFIIPVLLGGFVCAVAMLLSLAIWFGIELTRSPAGLWYATRKGWAGTVRSAALHGVPLDAPDELGETALMRAAAAGHTEAIKVLLLHGANPLSTNAFGQSATDIAVSRGHGDVVAVLAQVRATTVPSPVRPVSRPSVRCWLIASGLLGAVLILGWAWVAEPWPTAISFTEVEKLVRDRQVEGWHHAHGFVVGEVKKPEQHPNLWRGRFIAPAPAGVPDPITLLRKHDPEVGKLDRLPLWWKDRTGSLTGWAVLLLLVLPVVIAGLLSLPVGADSWFPTLARALPVPSQQPRSRDVDLPTTEP